MKLKKKQKKMYKLKIMRPLKTQNGMKPKLFQSNVISVLKLEKEKERKYKKNKQK